MPPRPESDRALDATDVGLRHQNDRGGEATPLEGTYPPSPHPPASTTSKSFPQFSSSSASGS
jgi:hypothetical protein